MKTGTAVFLSVVTSHWFGTKYAAFAAVAAVLAVQPSVTKAHKLFSHQLLGNLVGGVMAAMLGYWLGSSSLSMALAVILVLGLLPRMGLAETANLAVVAAIFILDRPEHDFLLYTGLRILATSYGMLIGYLVNRLIHPPDFQAKLREELDATGAEVDTFILHLIRSLSAPELFAKPQIKARAANIHRRLEGVRHFLRLTPAREGEQFHRLAMEKTVNSMFVFIERIMDIHKLALQAGGLGQTPERGAVAQSLENVMLFRQEVMSAALVNRTPVGATALAFQESLADLQNLIDRLLEEPDRRPVGLALYAILTNIRHMGWRMESLARILSGEGIPGEAG